jgi:hypothetical protein
MCAWGTPARTRRSHSVGGAVGRQCKRRNGDSGSIPWREKSDTVKAKGELNPARKATSEALDAFVSYVEIMATTPQKQKRAAAMLTPLDAIIATRRATNVKSSGGEPSEPEQDEEQDEDDGSDE